MSKDIDEMAAIITSYQDALNASNADQVMSLYASNAVFMPQHSPASIGLEAVRQAHIALFSSTTLRIRFKIEEIVPTNADWAFARTTSEGAVTIRTGPSEDEASQGLILFQKIEGEWKIARYCFCTMNARE